MAILSEEHRKSSEAWLARTQAVAAAGFQTQGIADLRRDLLADGSPATHAALLWALGETRDWTMIWWLADVAGQLDLVEALPLLRRQLPTLPPHSGLRDYRDDIRAAMQRLAAIARGSCPCRTATGPPSGYPELEALTSLSQQEPYCSQQTFRCRRCGRRYELETSEGYHYPIFAWRPLEP